MINTQLKIKGKISTVQKLLNSHNIFSSKANLTLRVKVKVTSFQIRLRHLDIDKQFKLSWKHTFPVFGSECSSD